MERFLYPEHETKLTVDDFIINNSKVMKMKLEGMYLVHLDDGSQSSSIINDILQRISIQIAGSIIRTVKLNEIEELRNCNFEGWKPLGEMISENFRLLRIHRGQLIEPYVGVIGEKSLIDYINREICAKGYC